jgi:hypothetical protein|tara:strand:- start:1052 stop:1888 length:837 start_codon:yes stop_codon:yes gene_type:complete
LRNNQDRFAASGAPNAPEPPSEANNSLFDFARPTEFVDLPTKGRFYSEAHPLKGKETVEIRYMTAKEEDILTSKTLLKSGMAIDRLIGSILVDKSINVASLYASDKNAILVACRISGFGPEYETRVNCPACGTSAPYMFDLNECRPYFGNEQLEVGDDGTFAVILPVTKIDARLKILNSKEEAFLTQLAENKAKKNLPESILTDQLKAIIVSLNGQTERSTINKFVDIMPARDSRFLRKEYVKASPGVEMKNDFKCSSCGHEQEVDIPLTADFFWSNR